MRWALGISLALWVGSCPVAAARHAVLVGNSRGGPNYEPLRYVRQDLEELSSVLTTYCGFEPDRVSILYDKQPSDLVRALEGVRTAVGGSSSNDLLLVYYSGHAERGKLLMGDNVLDFGVLRNSMEQVGSSIRIGIFDACQSGAFARAKGGVLAEPFMFTSTEKVAGQVILYSSSANESSQESDIYKNSVFTFHLLNALRGAGDASGDRKVTLSEAYQYSYNHTVSSTARSAVGAQHPGYKFKIQGEGNIVLADLTIRTSGILLAQDLSGSFTISDSANTVVAEFEKASGSPAMVALSPAWYRIVNHTGTIVLSHSLDIVGHEITRIDRDRLRPVRPGATSTKGTPAFVQFVGPKLWGGVASWDHQATAGAMTEAYEEYRVLGVDPVFEYPTILPTIGFEVEVMSRYGAYAYVGGEYRHVESEHRMAGRRAGPEGKGTYGSLLVVCDTVRSLSARVGIGYRLPKTPLRHLGVHVGVGVERVTLESGWRVTEDLFQSSDSGHRRVSGLPITPHVGLDYQFPVASHFVIGLGAEYRVAAHPHTLDEESGASHEGVEYSSRGFRAGGYAMVPIGRGVATWW